MRSQIERTLRILKVAFVLSIIMLAYTATGFAKTGKFIHLFWFFVFLGFLTRAIVLLKAGRRRIQQIDREQANLGPAVYQLFEAINRQEQEEWLELKRLLRR